jgi:hypothetical protein
VIAILLMLLFATLHGEELQAQTSCPQAIGSDVDRDGIDDFCDDSYAPPITAPAPNPGYGAKRILVVHLKFPELSTPPVEIEKTRDRLTGSHPFSVSQFFSEVSFGATQPSWDIRPWADLPHSRAYYEAADSTGNRLVLDALDYAGANYDLRDIDIVALLLSPIDSVRPGIFAYVPPGVPVGTSGFTRPVAVLTLNPSFNGSSSIVHEIGHAYGFLHSAQIVCKTWPFGIPPTLTDPFYSDTPCGIFSGAPDAIFTYAGYDFMGAQSGHPNSFQKWQAGWLKPAQIIEAPSSGSFTIDAYETASDGAKTIRIPYGTNTDGKPIWYWIEYRAKPAVDLEKRTLRSYPADRVLVWVNLPDVVVNATSFDFGTSDAPTPPLQPDGMFLPPGGKFTDPYRGFRISRGEDVSSGGVRRASVRVDTSALKFNPSLGVKLGPHDTRDVRVSNTGDTAIVFGRVRLGGRNPAAFDVTFDSCSNVTLQHGAECRISLARSAANNSGVTYAQLELTTSDPLWPTPTIGLIGQPVDITSIMPEAPVIETPKPSENGVLVFFSPRSAGTGSVVDYTASCTGGFSHRGAASPIAVKGLPVGIATKCVVKMTTTIGDSEWSAVSSPVTPLPSPRRRTTRSSS